MTNELEAAYRATVYQVYLPIGAVALRVDRADATFVRWLADESVDCWALMTAFNPGGKRMPDDFNREQQSALEIGLLEQGLEPYTGENIAEAGDWPNEETCLILNISLPTALATARKFQQNAILYGGTDGVPQLIWVDREE